jgi:hypothetical protein
MMNMFDHIFFYGNCTALATASFTKTDDLRPLTDVYPSNFIGPHSSIIRFFKRMPRMAEFEFLQRPGAQQVALEIFLHGFSLDAKSDKGAPLQTYRKTVKK